MEHRDFKIDYNEILFKERDCIAQYLKTIGRNSFHLSEKTIVIDKYGTILEVTDIKLDKDKVIIFKCECSDHPTFEPDWFECTKFCYGQLENVMDKLPNIEDFLMENTIDDLIDIQADYNTEYLLKDYPFEYMDKKYTDYEVHSHISNGFSQVVLKGEDYQFSTNDLMPLQVLLAHLRISILRCSTEYKDLMDMLELEDNLRFDCNDNNVPLTINGVNVDVFSVSRDDKGNLTICSEDIANGDTIVLNEKDIKPEYLTNIIVEIEKRNAIMDTYNAHNPELVMQINRAWTTPKYHMMFPNILYAMAQRDAQEIKDNYQGLVIDSPEVAMCEAHLILEHVCDDKDLETILGFLRYEEPETDNGEKC